ncbi:1,4-beta-D-glucan glucohydrolase, partial [Xanthomonas sontii]
MHTQTAGARAPLRTVLAAAAALGLLALAAAVPGRSVPVAPAAAPPPPIHPDRWPSPAWPLKEDPALEARITKLMAQMSVEQKVGQTVQGDIGSMTPEDVRKYHIGSVLAGGNSDPGGKYDASPAQWLALADAYYTASMQTEGAGPAIPIIFGIDAVHGQSNIVGATLFPHNIGLGATRDPELMRKIGEITAAETRTTGMEWTFAPTVAVPQDDRWGRTYEGYSESPEVVASFAGKVVEGLQGVPGTPGFLDGSHVISSVKHFLGDGGTTDGKDQGDTRISEQQLRDIHGAGYPPAIAAGAQTVMASFNSVNGVKMHGNTVMLTDVLKGQMHFGGFVVGDWNGHAQVPGCRKDDCPAAFNAGVDMLMAPDSWKGVYENALKAVKSGQIPMARLDDAVRRILRVKLRLGLFEAGKPSQRPLGGKFELLGAPEHRAVARQAVRESLVLLKNQGQLLPLKPQLKLLVAGDGANDMGKQAGGWTLNWQGTGTKRADYPNGTTIWEGLQQQVGAAGGSAELAVDGKFATKPDVAVGGFGEHPYAGFPGDIATL